MVLWNSQVCCISMLVLIYLLEGKRVWPVWRRKLEVLGCICVGICCARLRGVSLVRNFVSFVYVISFSGNSKFSLLRWQGTCLFLSFVSQCCGFFFCCFFFFKQCSPCPADEFHNSFLGLLVIFQVSFLEMVAHIFWFSFWIEMCLMCVTFKPFSYTSVRFFWIIWLLFGCAHSGFLGGAFLSAAAFASTLVLFGAYSEFSGSCHWSGVCLSSHGDMRQANGFLVE